MKQPFSSRRRPEKAFTLIELLVVVAIIAILAGLIFPVTKALKMSQMKKKSAAELAQLQTIIENYKAKTGVYPPDNPGNLMGPHLFFELAGATFNPTTSTYTTLDGEDSISVANLNTISGGRLSGLVNSSTSKAATDDKPAPINFLKDAHLKPGQVAVLTIGGFNLKMLVCSTGWGGPVSQSPNGTDIAPWHYVSSNPTNNPNSYDLWVDVMIDGKSNRVCNWSKTPLIVP